MSESKPTSPRKSRSTSTQPTQPEGELLGRIRKVSDAKIGNAISSVENLTADEEEGHKRHLRSSTRRSLNSIKIRFLWFLFYLMCGITTAVTVGFLALVVKWVATFYDDPPKLGAFISSTVWSVLLVLATLFIENVLKGKDD